MKTLPDNFKIILSRTDSIGDAVLTLPMAGWLKSNFGGCEIYFLGRSYTKNVVALSKHVDGFINYDDLENLPLEKQVQIIKTIGAQVFIHVFPKKEIAFLAKMAAVQLRVGTSSRLYHWLYCNKLVKLSRKKSNLHEAQLNIKLLSFLNKEALVPVKDIPAYYGFTRLPKLNAEFDHLLDRSKFNLILHPKSKGSAREWGSKNFLELIRLLPKNKFKIFISGTEKEGALIPEILTQPDVTDLTGKMSLDQFIAFINACDGLIAASTGPLHLAAALNKKAIGLFVSRRPIHPGRWMPLGKDAHYLVFDENCLNCREGKDCDCITRINPDKIIDLLKQT